MVNLPNFQFLTTGDKDGFKLMDAPMSKGLY
jgi:hypothetical protein